MGDQSGSSRFQDLFESALQHYEHQTGISLPDHPLAQQLQTCNSVESIIALLQQQANAFSEFRGSDRILKSLKNLVSVLCKLSATAHPGDAVGLSFPHAKVVHTGLAVLLNVIKDVIGSYDALVELLESIELFLKRLDIYTKIPHTVALTEIVVKIMVELLSTLALATTQIQQGRAKKFVKKFFGEKDVEVVLQRLDRLTQDEARTTAAQTLEVVYGLMQNMRVVMDDGKASADNVRDALELMQKMASDINRSKRDKFQQDLQSWLSPPDPWKNHNIARETSHSGTADWFVHGDTFSEWKRSGPGSLLWIHGKRMLFIT
ncbi:hypothetical protein BJV74DRAFT_618971 [Russula compacta]|nr:hypothetical protein BJV74DRAFT_618971 [Russula compacta]